jgi:hypothetical protein
LGSFLIKRVIGELQIEFPGIEHFCTLSPIPKFRSWLEWASEKDVRESIAPEMVDALLKASHATTVKEAIKVRGFYLTGVFPHQDRHSSLHLPPDHDSERTVVQDRGE